MKGVLILAHGSRAKETEITLDKIIEMVKAQLADCPLEVAFMEFSDRTIEKGLLTLIEKGVKDIKVVPYFLFSGIHIKEDIPHELQEFLKDYPNVKITMGDTLGADKRLADILLDRINA